jgi:acyl-CoA synthetase (AMP-forming)/AMP-acid ligase II
MTAKTDAGAPTILTSSWPYPFVPNVSVPEFLLATAAQHADKPALVDASDGRSLSYEALADGIHRVAAGLGARGLRPGDAFAIMAPNSPEWLVACYGAMAAGAIVTGINPLYKPDEVATQLIDADARFILTIPAVFPVARDAVARAGGRARIIVLGTGPDGTIPFTELLSWRGAAPREDVDPDALALMPYSSGTTGLPKGVMLTHRACLTNIMQILTAMPMGTEDRVLAVPPFFHGVGLSVLAGPALMSGATLVTMPRFDVTGFAAAIADHQITMTVVVPPIVQALAKHPAVDDYDLSSLRVVGCGAAPLGAELQQACAQRIGSPVLQGYGMTEATAGVSLAPLGMPEVPGSSGRLLPGVRARIVDPDTGAHQDPGSTGELLVRTPALMSGYLGKPEATNAAVDRDGWLHTGDIARFDADGNLFIVDRVKELIKVKGFQVAPAELEAILRNHPCVKDAAVVAMPDARAGEVPKAYVVPARDVPTDELIAYVADQVAPYKQIRDIEFIETIPTSPSGKTLRRLLTSR